MSTEHRVLVGGVVGLWVLGGAGAAFAGSWTPEVTIFPQQPTLASNAFALDEGGSEVWVTGVQATSLTATASAAQRTFGGAWSALTSFASVHAPSLPVGVALGADNHAAATWEDVIALRSPAGVWQAPVSLGLAGSPSNFQAKLDAQGNGVAVWGRLTDTNSVIEAVTWTASGTFGGVVQLSSSSHGAFAPQLAVNDAGTAVVVWLASPPRDNADPYQVESATRPAGGSWSAVTEASPNVPQTWARGRGAGWGRQRDSHLDDGHDARQRAASLPRLGPPVARGAARHESSRPTGTISVRARWLPTPPGTSPSAGWDKIRWAEQRPYGHAVRRWRLGSTHDPGTMPDRQLVLPRAGQRRSRWLDHRRRVGCRRVDAQQRRRSVGRGGVDAHGGRQQRPATQVRARHEQCARLRGLDGPHRRALQGGPETE